MLAGPLNFPGGGADEYALALATLDQEINARARAFHDRLLPRLEAVPEVQSVAYASGSPLYVGGGAAFSLDGEAAGATQAMRVGEAFFQTVEIPLLEGRLFVPEDFGRGPPVVIVNEAFARRFLEGSPRLGRRLSSNFPESEIV